MSSVRPCHVSILLAFLVKYPSTQLHLLLDILVLERWIRMPSNGVQDRISELLEKSDAATKSGDLQQAFEAVKEASHLDANNARVKEALVALQDREQSGDALVLVQAYFENGDDKDGQKALQELKQKQISEAEANRIFDLLEERRTDELPLLDAITGALIYKSNHVRKAIASRFSHPIAELFTTFFNRGEDSFKAFSSVPHDASVWPIKGDQAAAQVDLFQLCIAKLMDAAVEHPERLMQVVSRQLGVAPENVKAKIDRDVMEVILSSLNIRLASSLRSQAMLATSKALEVTQESGEQLFGQFLAEKVAKPTNDDLITAFSAAAAIFPMIPAFAAKLFMTDGFVQQLVPSLERNSEAASHGQR